MMISSITQADHRWVHDLMCLVCVALKYPTYYSPHQITTELEQWSPAHWLSIPSIVLLADCITQY